MKRSPIRKRSKRRKELRDRQFGADGKSLWINQLNCVKCGRLPCDAHHVRTRGAGGTSKDLVPLCRKDHDELHRIGRQTFEARYDLDLKAKAELLEEWWQRGHETGDYPLGF